MITEALILGLSTGTYCAMFCAPVVLPFIFSEEITTGKRNALLVSLFLFGRLVGYVLIGAVLGYIGAYALGYLDPVIERRIAAYAYIAIGLTMTGGALLYHFPNHSFCKKFSSVYTVKRGAFFYGVMTGLRFCPPFFAAASRVFMSSNGVFNGALYFILFFIGTSIWFIPLFGVHLLHGKMSFMRMISRMAMLLLGIYFTIFLGLLYLLP